MSGRVTNIGALALAKTFAVFLDENEGKRSDCTLTGYRVAMKSFASFAAERLGATMQNFDFTYFTEANVSRFLEWMQDKKGATPQTCNLRLCQLRAFLKYASKDPEVLPYYLSLRRIVRYVTENRTRVVEPLSKNTIQAIMAAPGTSTKTGLRYTLMLAMFYTMALRVGEILSIRIRDIVLTTNKPYVTVVGKGRKARVVYFMSATLKLLRKYIVQEHGKTPNPDAYLFFSRTGGPFTMSSARGVNKQLKVYALAVGKSCAEAPSHVHSHQFRHSMATHLLEDGMNVFQISKMLGHESVDTTMNYLGVTVSMTESAIKKVESTAVRNVRPIWPRNHAQLQDLF